MVPGAAGATEPVTEPAGATGLHDDRMLQHGAARAGAAPSTLGPIHEGPWPRVIKDPTPAPAEAVAALTQAIVDAHEDWDKLGMPTGGSIPPHWRGEWAAWLIQHLPAGWTLTRVSSGAVATTWRGEPPALTRDHARVAYVPAMGEPDEAWCRQYLAHPGIQRYLAARDHARCEALREALAGMLANLERWTHGEDCGVWSCKRCDAAEDRDHRDPYDDPTHAGCDCGLSEVVTKARAALAEPAP